MVRGVGQQTVSPRWVSAAGRRENRLRGRGGRDTLCEARLIRARCAERAVDEWLDRRDRQVDVAVCGRRDAIAERRRCLVSNVIVLDSTLSCPTAPFRA